MKKIISVLLSAAMAVSALSVGAYARSYNPDEEIMPMYESMTSVSASITANSKTVTCKSTVIPISSEKWITMTQTVEKKSDSGNWSPTSHTWTKNADNQSKNYSFSNYAVLSNGTYRLKCDVLIKLSNGTTETVTKYSSTVTI